MHAPITLMHEYSRIHGHVLNIPARFKTSAPTFTPLQGQWSTVRRTPDFKSPVESKSPTFIYAPRTQKTLNDVGKPFDVVTPVHAKISTTYTPRPTKTLADVGTPVHARISTPNCQPVWTPKNRKVDDLVDPGLGSPVNLRTPIPKWYDQPWTPRTKKLADFETPVHAKISTPNSQPSWTPKNRTLADFMDPGLWSPVNLRTPKPWTPRTKRLVDFQGSGRGSFADLTTRTSSGVSGAFNLVSLADFPLLSSDSTSPVRHLAYSDAEEVDTESPLSLPHSDSDDSDSRQSTDQDQDTTGTSSTEQNQEIIDPPPLAIGARRGRKPQKFDCAAISRRKQRRARTAYNTSNGCTSKRGKPVFSTTPRALEYQKKQEEKEAVKRVVQMLTNAETREFALEELKKISQTSAAIKEFGNAFNDHVRGQNVSHRVGAAAIDFVAFGGVGRNPKQGLVGSLGANLKTKEASEYLDVTPRYFQKARKYADREETHLELTGQLEVLNAERKLLSKEMTTLKRSAKRGGGGAEVNEEISKKRQTLQSLGTQIREMEASIKKTKIKHTPPLRGQYQANTKKTTVHSLESEIYSAHFTEFTTNQSGDKSALRRMNSKLYEFHANLHGHYPAYLRDKATLSPDVHEKIQQKTIHTRFEKSWLSAVKAGEQTGFERKAEFELRKKRYTDAYHKKLISKRVNPFFDDSGDEDFGADTNFYPQEFRQTAFWSHMKALGHRFTFRINDTICMLCDTYEANKCHFEKVIQRFAQKRAENSELEERIASWENTVIHKIGDSEEIAAAHASLNKARDEHVTLQQQQTARKRNGTRAFDTKSSLKRQEPE